MIIYFTALPFFEHRENWECNLNMDNENHSGYRRHCLFEKMDIQMDRTKIQQMLPETSQINLTLSLIQQFCSRRL